MSNRKTPTIQEVAVSNIAKAHNDLIVSYLQFLSIDMKSASESVHEIIDSVYHLLKILNYPDIDNLPLVK
jgi:hypothetical protein